MHGSQEIHEHVRGVIESRQSICTHLVTMRGRDACLFLGPHMDSFTGVSRLVRANHGPCFAARRILLYHPVPKSPTVTLDLPATHHHPHSAAVGPPPKAYFAAYAVGLTQYILWRRSCKNLVEQLALFFFWAKGPGIPAWTFPSAVQGQYAATWVLCSYVVGGPAGLACSACLAPGERERENPHKSTSTSRSPPSTSLCDPPGRQGRYQISHMQRITGRREGVTIDHGPRANGSLLG